MVLSQIKKNIIYRLIEAFCISVTILFQFSLLAKYLSYQDFGIYSLGMLWSFLIIAASYSFSLPVILSRELCQRDQAKEVISNIFLSQLVIGVITLAVVTPLLLYMDYFQGLSSFGFLAFVMGSLLLAAPISMQGILVSQEKMGSIALIKIIAHLLNYFAILLIIHWGLGLQWIFASHLILAIVFALGFFFWSGTKLHLHFQSINLKEFKYYIAQASPIVLMAIATQLYCRIDIIMVDAFRGKEQVALYSSAYKVLDYLLTICNAVIIAIFPNLMKIAHDISKFKEFYKNLLKIVIAGLFPMAILVTIFASSIMNSLYGESYQSAASTLQILMLAGCVSFLNSPSSTIFIAYKNQRSYLTATVLSLIVNILGNYLLIPLYDYKGAAIATLLTELFMLAYCSIYIRKLMLQKS